jgi:Uma2 family endonuclease
MGTTTTGLITFEEFETLPETPGKQELLDGEVIELPPAKKKHNQSAHRIYHALLAAIEAIGRQQDPLRVGEPYLVMGYRVSRDPDSWLVPDVSIAHPDQPGEEYLEGAPLLAIEVVSPSNRADHMDRKRKLYLENGAVEVWVVYPKTKSVWVFRAGHAQEFTNQVRSEIIPGFSADIGQLLV